MDFMRVKRWLCLVEHIDMIDMIDLKFYGFLYFKRSLPPPPSIRKILENYNQIYIKVQLTINRQNIFTRFYTILHDFTQFYGTPPLDGSYFRWHYI